MGDIMDKLGQRRRLLQGQEVRGLREVQGALQDGQDGRPQPEGLPLHLRPAMPAAGGQAAREEGAQGRLQERRPADHDGEDLREGRQELQGLQGRRRQDSRGSRQGGRGRQQQLAGRPRFRRQQRLLFTPLVNLLVVATE